MGIVDGLFHHVRSVRHKEILSVLAKGVRVLGASSMGALRAAELDRYGMEGVGRIYAEYRDGRIEGDDEVALLHGSPEEQSRSLCEPLVNIRATLERAVTEGACEEATASRLIAALRAMHYGERSYRRMIHEGRRLGLDEGLLDRLKTFCAEHAVHLKRADALLLFEAMKKARSEPPRRPMADELSRTIYLSTWQIGALRSDTGDGLGPVHDVDALRACQLFFPDYPDFYRRFVIAWIGRECVEQCGATSEDRPAERAIQHAVHRGLFELHEGSDQGLAFLDAWSTSEERRTLQTRERLALFLVRHFRIVPRMVCDELVLEELRPGPMFARGRRLVTAAEEVRKRVYADNPGFHVSELDDDRLIDWFRERWRVTAEDFSMAVRDRGFQSMRIFLGAARSFYLFAKYNPELLDDVLSG